jgi:hypothetical protein
MESPGDSMTIGPATEAGLIASFFLTFAGFAPLIRIPAEDRSVMFVRSSPIRTRISSEAATGVDKMPVMTAAKNDVTIYFRILRTACSKRTIVYPGTENR